MKFLFFAYSYYLLSIEAASAVVGLTAVRRNWTPWYKLLVIMCCATVVSESCAFYQYLKYGHSHSAMLYNTWAPIETFIIVYILFRETTLRWCRRLLLVLLIALPAGLLIAYLLPPGFAKSNLYADTIELLIEVLASCTLLVDILSDMSEGSLYTNPKFWLSIGILVSACTFTLILAARRFMASSSLAMYYYMPFSFVANTFMYGGIMSCFIVIKKRMLLLPKLT